MKRTSFYKYILLLTLSLSSFLTYSQYLRRDNMNNFMLFLDNGIDRIDLSKTQSCSKSFFTRGAPRLVIVKKVESSIKLNLVLKYNAFFYQDIMGKPPGFYKMTGSAFSDELIREIMTAPIHSRIMLAEILLDVPEKSLNPHSQKMAAFFVHIE